MEKSSAEAVSLVLRGHRSQSVVSLRRTPGKGTLPEHGGNDTVSVTPINASQDRQLVAYLEH